MSTRARRLLSRRGAIAPLTAILIVFLIAMVAFVVDFGTILVARSEAQNVADSASLAGMSKLAEKWKASPISGGGPTQTATDLESARIEIKAFAAKNKIRGVDTEVADADIDFGYMADPYNHASDTLDTTGWPARPYNAVRVRVYRNSSHGGEFAMFFAPLLGKSTMTTSASATAVFAMGTMTPQGDTSSKEGGLLPFAYQIDQWNALINATGAGSVAAANGVTLELTDQYGVASGANDSDDVSTTSDNLLEVNMYPHSTTSGNFGTINFSKTKVNNSTSELSDIIEDGPDADDWPDLADIVKATSANPVAVNGDPGISAGVEDAVETIVGEGHILPLYSVVEKNGNNSYYSLVGFAPITIVSVNLSGNNKHITMQPRVMGYKSQVMGSDKIHFSITPGASPNEFFIGARSLVR